MADAPQAEEQVVTETQPEAMPTSDQKTSEFEQETPAQAGQSEADEELKLPEDVKPRTTEQFEKLQRKLADEREKRIRAETAFRSFQPQQQAVPQPVDWFDPVTGTVDVNRLNERERVREARISQLETKLYGFSEAEDKKQEKEAYTAYPDLDPKGSKFDDDFHEQVVNTLGIAYAKGENITVKQAADKVISLANKRSKLAETQGAKKALEQLLPKEQAALEATGRSDRRLPSRDLSSLRQATQKGDFNAILERMKGIPSVGA